MAKTPDNTRPLEDDDELVLHSERDFAENTGNEGCGYDSARGSHTLLDRDRRGFGADLESAVDEAVDKVMEKVKGALGGTPAPK